MLRKTTFLRHPTWALTILKPFRTIFWSDQHWSALDLNWEITKITFNFNYVNIKNQLHHKLISNDPHWLALISIRHLSRSTCKDCLISNWNKKFKFDHAFISIDQHLSSLSFDPRCPEKKLILQTRSVIMIQRYIHFQNIYIDEQIYSPWNNDVTQFLEITCLWQNSGSSTPPIAAITWCYHWNGQIINILVDDAESCLLLT